MKSKRVLFILFFWLIPLLKSEILEIEDGKLEGAVLYTRNGAKIYAYLNIPYAEPPVGNLRFKPPVQNKKWTGIRDAKTPGPKCMQFFNDPQMSEDCLYLNVYTKYFGHYDDLKPVIVYIHSGGFLHGTGYGHFPDYLLDRDVVFVTINYRLGPLGFLSLGTKDVTGNMGLKDQTMALKWIQRNIAKFGGNPNSVTIAGSSAGSFSVTAHMGSQMSRGLFHRVIGMSGAITWQKGLESNNLALASELAQKLGCSTNVEEMYQCLMQKSGKDIALAAPKYLYSCWLMPWLPVVESDFGQERFFTDQPNKLFKSGNFNQVPVIIGITADEVSTPVHSLLSNKNSLNALNTNFAQTASECFFFTGTSNKSVEEVASTLRNYYFPYAQIDARSFDGLHQLSSDGFIGYGVHRFVHYVSSYTDLYYFKFSFVGRYSHYNYPRNEPYGAHHSDDIQYMLALNYMPRIKVNDPENFMVERMTRIWEQFALTGDPNNPYDEFLANMVWPKHDYRNEYFLDIGNFLIEKQGLNLKRYSVWDNLEESPYDYNPDNILADSSSSVVENIFEYFKNLLSS